MNNSIITVEDVINEWTKDSVIDELEPGTELLKISKLHSKYLRIISQHQFLVKSFQAEYSKLKKIKWEYYSGDLNNPDDLKKYGYEPFRKKVMRQDIGTYLDADDDLATILAKKSSHEEVVKTCEMILKELNSRTFQIRSYIDWVKFTNGS